MSKMGVLKVLERAASDIRYIGRLTDNFSSAVNGIDLSREEYAALASGDIRWIEEHCGKLDERLRTWPECRLGQEVWGLPESTAERAEEEPRPEDEAYVSQLLDMLDKRRVGTA
jgi:hypothetical protein